MTLRIQKCIIVSIIAAVILLANAWVIAGWLDDAGLVAWARNLRSQYFTGTAVVVIVTLLVSIPTARAPAGSLRTPASQCPVCDGNLRPGGQYCPACGSRV